MIIEYRKEFCPMCDRVCDELSKRNIIFETRDLDESESIAELYSDGVFPQSAPVLKIGDEYFYDGTLFNGDDLSDEVITRIGAM
ncbi:MAG: glutaredoxin domain-containing protein [Dysgonamonadaceae bacterium]|jgi:glutaredoxin